MESWIYANNGKRTFHVEMFDGKKKQIELIDFTGMLTLLWLFYAYNTFPSDDCAHHMKFHTSSIHNSIFFWFVYL